MHDSGNAAPPSGSVLVCSKVKFPDAVEPHLRWGLQWDNLELNASASSYKDKVYDFFNSLEGEFKPWNNRDDALDPPNPPYWCIRTTGKVVVPPGGGFVWMAQARFDINLGIGINLIQRIRSDCDTTHVVVKHYCGITSHLECKNMEPWTVNYGDFYSPRWRANCGQAFKENGCWSGLQKGVDNCLAWE